MSEKCYFCFEMDGEEHNCDGKRRASKSASVTGSTAGLDVEMHTVLVKIPLSNLIAGVAGQAMARGEEHLAQALMLVWQEFEKQ